MKELKTRLQESRVSLVSVCCSIDVVAVANDCEIAIYRMPLSKISSTTLESSVRCMCWSPNGRILCVGTAEGVVQVNVEDGAIVRRSLQQSVQDIKWVSGLKSDTKKERPLLFLEANFNPLLLPVQESVEASAGTISGQVLEEAMASVSQKHYHFMLALTSDGTLHVSPYGIINVLSVPLPGASSVSAFHMLRSVCYTAPGAMRGVDITPLYKFKQLCAASVHHALLKEALGVILVSCVQAREKAEEAEKELTSIFGPNSPNLADLFTKGPVTEDDHIWVNNKCEPSRMQKTADIFSNNMSDVSRMLAGNVAPMVDHVSCLAQAACNVLPCDVYGPLCADLAELHTLVGTSACSVVRTRGDAANLLSWVLEMHKCCTKAKAAQQIEDCPSYDTQRVLDVVFKCASWEETTAGIDAITAAVGTISEALDLHGDELRAKVSQKALGGTEDIAACADVNSEISLSTTCSRYYTSIAGDKVIVTIVTDQGPQSAGRWCAKQGYLPLEGCIATSFYCNREEDELKLLTLSACETQHTLRMFTIVTEGCLTADFSTTGPVELPVEPCDVHELQQPFDSPDGVMLSSSTRGLACVAVTQADSSYVSMIDLEDEDVEEEEEEEEEGVEGVEIDE